MTSFVYTEAARAAERYSASLACLQASEPLAPSLFQQIVVDQLDTINIATRQYLRVFGSESNRPTTLGGKLIHYLLLLMEVLGSSAAEIAETLQTSVASVNSALQKGASSTRKTE